jgi:hypothetical protein
MRILSVALIGSALVVSGAVAATESLHAGQPASANQYYGLYHNPSQAIAPSADDSADFDRSGTRGRETLGAGFSNPEGPGNVSD